MYVIGLTGGIAAGKSTVARRLAEHGAVVLDADRLARDAVEPGTPGLAAIRQRFGDAVIAADGSLDRAALGAIVFGDEAARLDLNGITHPEVGRLLKQRLAETHATDPDAIVVYDVPLMVETGGRRGGLFEYVVVVESPESVRLERLTSLRGMSQEEAERRIRSQASDAERRAIGDTVIDSSGSLDETLAQVDALWQIVHERGREHTPAPEASDAHEQPAPDTARSGRATP